MNDDVIRVTSSVIINEKSRFWYVKSRKDGLWGLPAGKVESRESVEEAARRETLQELGVYARLEYIVGIYQFISSRGHSVFNVVYNGHITKGKPHVVRPKEISEIGIFSYEELSNFYKKRRLRAGIGNIRCIEDYIKGQELDLKIINNLMKR